MKCNHPEMQREPLQIYLPFYLSDDRVVYRNVPSLCRAFRCLECGAIVVPDGFLVEQMPVTYPSRVSLDVTVTPGCQ